MRLSQLQKDNALARSAAANEERRTRTKTVVDWDQAIANLHAILDDRRI